MIIIKFINVIVRMAKAVMHPCKVMQTDSFYPDGKIFIFLG